MPVAVRVSRFASARTGVSDLGELIADAPDRSSGTECVVARSRALLLQLRCGVDPVVLGRLRDPRLHSHLLEELPDQMLELGGRHFE
jgi:hypothetical protein